MARAAIPTSPEPHFQLMAAPAEMSEGTDPGLEWCPLPDPAREAGKLRRQYQALPSLLNDRASVLSG